MDFLIPDSASKHATNQVFPLSFTHSHMCHRDVQADSGCYSNGADGVSPSNTVWELSAMGTSISNGNLYLQWEPLSVMRTSICNDSLYLLTCLLALLDKKTSSVNWKVIGLVDSLKTENSRQRRASCSQYGVWQDIWGHPKTWGYWKCFKSCNKKEVIIWFIIYTNHILRSFSSQALSSFTTW